MALTKVPSNLDAAVSVTQSQSDNSTNVATTAYVDTAISNLSDSAPAALNTLNEIAAALGDDANYAATTTAAIAGKLPLAGGTMTGDLITTGLTVDTTTLVVDKTNNRVGIGTSSPGAKLHIESGASNEAIRINTSTGYNAAVNYYVNDTIKWTAQVLGDGTDAYRFYNFTSGEALRIAPGGDISFYEDTGTTPKFFWDASSESLSIGTNGSTTDRRFQVSATGPSTATTQFGIVANPTYPTNVTGDVYNLYSQPNVASGTTLTSLYNLYLGATGLSGSTITNLYGVYQAGASEKNYFAGTVGIGTTNPVYAKLQIESSSDQGLLIQLQNTDQDSNTYMRYKDWAGQYWDTGINWANNDYYFNYGGAFKARFTNAGGLQIDGSGGDTTPTLALNSTTSTTFNHSINAFNANLAGSENQLIVVGKEGSTKNSGYIGYKWIASGNNGNLLTFGHWGNDNLMNLTADGKLGIGTQGPIAPLDVNGAVSSIIAMTSAHGYSSNRNWRFVSNNFGSGNWGGFSLERSTGAGGTPSVPVWGIDINGNTGIGIGGAAGATQAGSKLHVYGNVGAVIRGENTYGYMSFGSSNASYAHHQTDRPTYFFPVPCQASGGFSTYSDSRLKENIEPVTGALDKVAIMNGVTFTWNNSEKTYGPEGKQFGVLAQNMLEVDSDLPSLKEDALELQENIDNADIDTQYYTMDYSRLTPFFIEAIKELKTKLEAAEARIAALEG